MRRFKAISTGFAFAFACVFSPASLNAQPATSDAPCVVSNGIVRITPQGMSDVREIIVTRPDGGIVYLYSPRLGVYNLMSPGHGLIEVNPASQRGAQYADDGKLHEREIFSDSGSYRVDVLGKSGKPVPGIQYSRLACSLDFVDGRGFQRATPLHGVARDPVSFISDCPAKGQPDLRAACNSSSGCQNGGHGYCCSSAGQGGPCYCNNCCVALTAGIRP
ncbi:hypothetical protein [Thermomonas sp.]|uniref:hypothetical protein n=1 Tax=Thermomonas sp. TaxID=1971895 RepID=UPI002634FEDE|nr:hypothetical protein [Thermomonas sp.]